VEYRDRLAAISKRMLKSDVGCVREVGEWLHAFLPSVELAEYAEEWAHREEECDCPVTRLRLIDAIFALEMEGRSPEDIWSCAHFHERLVDGCYPHLAEVDVP
jgi:hypothetical protein